MMDTLPYYSQLLQGECKLLGHVADGVFRAKNNREFFQLLVTEMTPVLREAGACEPLYHHWLKERELYRKKYERIENKAYKELKKTYDRISSLLEKDPITESSEAIQCLNVLYELFSSKYPSSFPLKKIYRLLTIVLFSLLKLGNEDIVSRFAEISSLNEVTIDQEGEAVSTCLPCVDCFTFAPSLEKLSTLNRLFSWDEVENDWVAWEYLTLAEQCWKLTSEEHAPGSALSNFRPFISEMRTIKEKEPTFRTP